MGFLSRKEPIALSNTKIMTIDSLKENHMHQKKERIKQRDSFFYPDGAKSCALEVSTVQEGQERVSIISYRLSTFTLRNE
jgi:hypothetical protein